MNNTKMKAVTKCNCLPQQYTLTFCAPVHSTELRLGGVWDFVVNLDSYGIKRVGVW